MKYGPYEITKYDNRNVVLHHHEDKEYLDNQFIPNGKKAGDEYVSTTLIGYYQKPEQWLNAIFDHMCLGVDFEQENPLANLLFTIQESRKFIAEIAQEAQQHEEIWP